MYFPKQNQLVAYINLLKDQAPKLQLPLKHIFSAICLFSYIIFYLVEKERKKQRNIQKESIFYYLRDVFLTTFFNYN